MGTPNGLSRVGTGRESHNAAGAGEAIMIRDVSCVGLVFVVVGQERIMVACDVVVGFLRKTEKATRVESE